MKLSDFDYFLPQKSIAQTPAEPRDSAKLLHLSRQDRHIKDRIFCDIEALLWKNDVLVVNQTKVINARLKWVIQEKDAPCEIFLHKQISDTLWDCLVYPGKKLKVGTKISFIASVSWENKENQDRVSMWEKQVLSATIVSISEKGRIVEFSQWGEKFFDVIDTIGEVPLPPYIKNSHAPSERYQTVYHDSSQSWSVAAPTAGLHFTPELLEKLKKKWVKIEKVLLHVWLGTFANVEIEDITKHHMHSEYIEIKEDVSQRLNKYKSEWKRIIAVGTTSVRTLESFSSDSWHLWHGSMETKIFIYPGYQWKFVDSIITNFHLPKSTLLMLVSSFAWSDYIKKAYEHAVDSQYRFFSFGDAMWIE